MCPVNITENGHRRGGGDTPLIKMRGKSGHAIPLSYLHLHYAKYWVTITASLPVGTLVVWGIRDRVFQCYSAVKIIVHSIMEMCNGIFRIFLS